MAFAKLNNKSNKITHEIDENTKLFFLAGPIFVELLLNILIHNADTVMLGRFSPVAVGAVGNANQIMFLFIVMFNVIATATNVIVAQYLGAKQFDKMNQIYTLSFVVNLVIGIALSAFLYFIGPFLFKLLKVPEEMMPDCIAYTKIVGSCLFLQAGFNVMVQILRCNGYTKVGMYISICVNLLNILGNWLFLYGPWKFLGLGVKGAAISTSFSRVVALLAAILIFYILKIGKLSLKTLRPFPFNLLWKELKIGLPTAGENMAYSLAQTILFSFINPMGAAAVNAKVMAQSLMNLNVAFSNSVAMSTQIITGHLIGAEKEDAAYRRVMRSLLMTLPVTLVLASTNCFLSPWSLKLFGATPEVIVLAKQVMMVGIFMELGRTTNLIVVGSLKAAGDYIFPVVIGMISMWIIGISVGYTSGVIFALGAAGVFMGTMADECIRGIIVVIRWKKGKWRNKSVVER
ncbi:MAG: MATE family efflux transporter [Treponema sp.]|nr:MATE family efflux transporter [Treponema sp.]